MRSCAASVGCLTSIVTDGSAERGSVPPPICARPVPTRTSSGRPVERGDDPFGAAAQLVVADLHHLDDRNPRVAAQIGIDRGLERRQDQLVTAKRTEQRLPLERVDHPPAADDDASLRPAEQFVAAEAHEIDASPNDLRRSRLVLHAFDGLRLHDRAAPEVLDERNPFASSQRGEVLGGR